MAPPTLAFAVIARTRDLLVGVAPPVAPPPLFFLFSLPDHPAKEQQRFPT